jgi:RluA family pseudouridine synthase
VAKPNYIELAGGERLPILYEDRSVLAIDKPRGWMLAPDSWNRTARNLQAALETGIVAREFWARSRNLRFLRFIHRLDADTSGVLLLARSKGALGPYSRLFASHQMEKRYLAVVKGTPSRNEWICRIRFRSEVDEHGKIRVDAAKGKEAETHFRVLMTEVGRSLVEARPITGRTHQIRVHLAESGHPVMGDELYGDGKEHDPLGLRAVCLCYADPFTKKRVKIEAPAEQFLRKFGFEASSLKAEVIT